MLVAGPDGFNHLSIIPGIGGIGVGEQQHQVDLVVGDPGVDLLVAALLVGQEKRNGQTGISAISRPVVAVANRLCLLSTLL